MNVVIQGDGIAARCSAHLLAQAGFHLAVESSARAAPTIMIGHTTQGLLRDVFESADLFRNLTAVSKRIVIWGRAGVPRVFPHSAVVVPEQLLLEQLPLPHAVQTSDDFAPDWTIRASRILDLGCVPHHAGHRVARAIRVMLARNVEPDACWVESLEYGWLFLLPDGAGGGFLLAVGESPDALLEASRLVHRQVAAATGSAGEFVAHPRLVWPLSGAGWLACGSGAMGFDPLCGDGSGHAVREAILAAAALGAMQRGEEPDGVVPHYCHRLLAGFRRHLEVCREYYRDGGSSPWWTDQVTSFDAALRWCDGVLAEAPPARYRLCGFELVKIS